MDAGARWLVLGIWVTTGLGVGWWMMRRGHSPRWIVIGMVLGPLLLPIAVERVERRPRRVATVPNRGAAPAARSTPRILVGLDGSASSTRSVAAVLGAYAPRDGQVMLVQVIGYDDTNPEYPAALAAAADHLTDAATRIRALVGDVSVTCEVVAGSPADALRRYATEQGVDLIIVGHRGHGMSTRVMGSVATALIRDAPVPVVVGAVPHQGATRSSLASPVADAGHG